MIKRRTPLKRSTKPIKRTPLKRSSKPIKRTPIKKKYKPTGELKLFKIIWEERPHHCAVCNAELTKFDPANFAHVLSKGAYRKLRLLKENIELLCFSKQGDGCHNKYDTAAQSNLIFGAGSLIKTKWKELFAKAYTLKQKYYAENKVTKK